MKKIMLAAAWHGGPLSLTGPDPFLSEWVRDIEECGAYAAYLDEPAGWRVVVVDEGEFSRALPRLKEYGVHGITEWRYDLLP